MNLPSKDEERIARLHLRELTREGGEELLLKRFNLEVAHTSWAPEEKQVALNLAGDVGAVYHQGDDRDDKTYATHVLRVATRILSRNHFNVRENPDLILAALLHDVIEDHPERLLGADAPVLDDTAIEARIEQRTVALHVIATRYGQHVADMVEGVSNPIYDKRDIPEHERQQIYREHVKHLMDRGGDERIIKLSDFIDNCLGLAHNPNPALRRKLAHKYYDLIPIMETYVTSSSLGVAVMNDVMHDLNHAKQLCEAYRDNSPAQKAAIGNAAMSNFPPDTAHAS